MGRCEGDQEKGTREGLGDRRLFIQILQVPLKKLPKNDTEMENGDYSTT